MIWARCENVEFTEQHACDEQCTVPAVDDVQEIPKVIALIRDRAINAIAGNTDQISPSSHQSRAFCLHLENAMMLV